MPATRTLLEALSRNEPLALVDRWGLTVEDRRVKDQLVEAAIAQASNLPAVLGESPVAGSRNCVASRASDTCRPTVVQAHMGGSLAVVRREALATSAAIAPCRPWRHPGWPGSRG